MQPWKRYLLIGLGFGAGLAIIAGLLLGVVLWYNSVPHAPKPWNKKAVIATFSYPEVEKAADSTNQLVLYYTLENTTDFDYRLPSRDQLQISAKLESEKSLSTNDQYLTLDNTNTMLPAKQRMRIGVHLGYEFNDNFGPSETTDERHTRRKAIEQHLNTKASNLDGFAAFDLQNRYEIDFPNGWREKTTK